MTRTTLARTILARTTLMAVLCLVIPAAFGSASQVRAAAPPVAGPGSGWARFGHFAAAREPVDVYVDGAVVASTVAFKSVTDYTALTAGAHTFEIKPLAQPNAPSVLTVVADVPDGHAITVGAVTTREGLAAQVYDDALAAPAPGASLVRFIHSAPDFPSVDIDVIGGAVIASQVAYPSSTPYQTIGAGTYDLEIRETGTSNVLVKVSAWSIQQGGQATVVIIKGLDGKLDVVPLADAAMAVQSPLGGVQTGFGGMSHASSGVGSSAPVLPLAVLAGALGCLAATAAQVRRLRLRAASR